MKRYLLLAATVLLAGGLTAQPTDRQQSTDSLQTADYRLQANKKLSPGLQHLLSSFLPHSSSFLHRPSSPAHSPSSLLLSPSSSIDMLVKFVDEADETALAESYGLTVKARIGRVLVVSVPMGKIQALADDAQVVRVEAERAGRPMLDLLPSQIGADKAWSGTDNELPQAFTGKDVVVGVVDCGFDYIHPFFRDGDGKTRVTWAADYLTGKKYTTTAAITTVMHSSDAATMFHGTHVAGIAAGSRIEDADWDQPTAYQGIACEADIAEGCINSEITDEGLSSATSIQAFNDIFNYAEEQGKPCVINYSLGNAMSFTDKRQLEEEAIRTLLEKPGRAIVVAAGNAGGTSRLAHKDATTSEGGCGVCFNEYEQYGTYFGVEVKVKSGQTLRLRHTDSSYQTVKAETAVTTEDLAITETFMMGSKRLTVYSQGQTTDGYYSFYITTGVNVTFPTTDRILITIQGEGEAWIYADPLCAELENVATIANHSLAQDGYSMAWPATMDDVISVGNIAHRFQILTMANKYAAMGGEVKPTDLTDLESTNGEGYLARSSSVGPTLAGGMKPDVCAPGVNIVSAQNFFIDDDTYYSLAGWDIGAVDTDYETWGGLSGYFHIMAQTGTSMAAPAVTGAIALWLQADPTLTVGRIKEILAMTCRQPDDALEYPNNQYGHGEIDIYKGLCHILGVNKIEGVSMVQPQGVRFSLNGGVVTASFAEDEPTGRQPELRVYSTDGRLLMTGQGTSINVSGLPHGVYAVQLNTGNKATTGSTLIRVEG
ncbi:MAG: S8 family peptidase [Prevotella sp.]|nr:S8 family peptidase [Prevotella sp.]